MNNSDKSNSAISGCPHEPGSKKAVVSESNNCPVPPVAQASADNTLLKIYKLLYPEEQEPPPAAAVFSDDNAKHAQHNPATNDFVFDQTQHKNSRLSTERLTSTIPRADFIPDHQPKEEKEKWVYPSEQQYFNAMKVILMY